MYRFEELIVWQRGVDFCDTLYGLTNDFPHQEQYGLISQLRRAAISIPTNIAEGTGDASDKEFLKFFRYALRSQHEVASLLRVAKRLGFLSADRFEVVDRDLAQVGRLLQGLIKAIKSSGAIREHPDSDLTGDLEILYREDHRSQDEQSGQ